MGRQRRTTRRFTAEFKAAAVQRALEMRRQSGSVARVARELDIDSSLLSGWIKAATPVAPEPLEESLEDEVRRLRREVETLRQERDFAKKAAAYFAQTHR